MGMSPALLWQRGATAAARGLDVAFLVIVINTCMLKTSY